MADELEIDFFEDSFLDELFKGCLKKKDFFMSVRKLMNERYLPENRGYREVWKVMGREFDVDNAMPSLGVLKQELRKNDHAMEVLGKMRKIVNPAYDPLIKTYAKFVKQKMFVSSFQNSIELYNNGEIEESLRVYTESAESLANFSMVDAIHDRVFKDFRKRSVERMGKEHDIIIPTGIDLLDHYMWGGTSKSETTLYLGDSGTGKSQLLIHHGIAAARRGYRVAHFQAEGTKQQVLDRYDAAWSGSLYKDIKFGHVPIAKLRKLYKTAVRAQAKADIYVETKEKFGSWTMPDIRASLIEMFKKYGTIDVVIIDYLELIEPGNGKNYSASEERHRQQAVARLMKDLAVEFNVSLITATQASSVPDDAKQNKDFILTRWNLSEDKGKLRPFDNFITINQTRDEKKDKIARLFIDKLREKPSDQIIELAQSFAYSRFYDRMRTLKTIYTDDVLEEMKLEQFILEDED